MAKRHYLQQAHTHADKHPVVGQFMSEKLDGHRCFWDGGVSRGIPKQDVPWANNANDERYKLPQIATGLWTRYGNVIHAPDWWLNKLPNYPLDGELHTGRGNFQQTSKFIKKLAPVDSEWRQVNYCVFDSPCLSQILYNSDIKQGSFERSFKDISSWIDVYSTTMIDSWIEKAPWNHHPTDWTFSQVYAYLQAEYFNDIITLVLQRPVYNTSMLDSFAAGVARLGGEGVILRSPTAIYEPIRSHSITKLKPYQDDEATVTGYITGRETNRGSKLLGLMGAIILDYNGHRLELSGFTDAERRLLDISTPNKHQATMNAFAWASENPETICPDDIEAIHFPRGSKITFRFRELSDSGIPKEARYLRPYGEV